MQSECGRQGLTGCSTGPQDHTPSGSPTSDPTVGGTLPGKLLIAFHSSYVTVAWPTGLCGLDVRGHCQLFGGEVQSAAAL